MSLQRKRLRIAVAGNPNCGKTTLFNELTGSRQMVGNWPGVTVDRKTGFYAFEATILNLSTFPASMHFPHIPAMKKLPETTCCLKITI